MIKSTQRNIEVYAHWLGLEQPVLMGILHATPSRGKEIFSFEYDKEWIDNNQNFTIDPGMQLFHGPQYAPLGQENFGVFLDSSPDRWGRVLMNRREAELARKEGRKEKKLAESDYLIGVNDELRMGGGKL
jgi:serine/threonine-protein kinase HipA